MPPEGPTQILELAREQFYVIGTVRETQTYTIASDRIHNVPNNTLQGWKYPTPGPTRPEQYFLSKE